MPYCVVYNFRRLYYIPVSPLPPEYRKAKYQKFKTAEDFQLSPVQTHMSILSNATTEGVDSIIEQESDIFFTNSLTGFQQNDVPKNTNKDNEIIFSEYLQGLLIPIEDEATAFLPDPSSDSAKNNPLQQSTQEKSAEVLRDQALPTKHDIAPNSVFLHEASAKKKELRLDFAVNESKPSIYVENPSTSREDSISSPQFLQDKAIDNSRPKPGTVANIARLWQANHSNCNKKTKTELCAESHNQSSPNNDLSKSTAQANDISRTTLSLNPVPKSSPETENSAASNIEEGDSLFINTPGSNPQESNSSRTNATPKHAISDEKYDQTMSRQLQSNASTESAFQNIMAVHVSATSLKKEQSLLLSMDKLSSPSIPSKTSPKNLDKTSLNSTNEENSLFSVNPSDVDISMSSQLPAKAFEVAVSRSIPPIVSSPDKGSAGKIFADGAATASVSATPFESILSSKDFVVSDSEANHFSPLTSKHTRIRDFPRFPTPFSALSAVMTERKRAQWNINN